MVAYTNDLRLAELATGEGSGTWGNTSNTNLELISEAFSFGTEAITTNADTHTTTIADGSTDPGRSMFLKYTGTLDSTCTITIGPNTVSKLWFIENATSGSQSIIIKQGSGATVTIANGQTKAIYSDGAGSGGAMVDAFQDLSIPDLFIDDDLTIGDDLVFSSDSAVITFGADGDTTLTHTDGSGLTLNSTNKLMFNDASQFIQGSSATVLSLGATDEIDLTATAIDVNGTLDVSGTTALGGAVTITETDSGSAAGPFLNLHRDSSSPADGDALGAIQFQGEDDGSNLTTYAAIKAEASDVTDGTEDGLLALRTIVGGSDTARLNLNSTAAVFNEGSADLDFRVESNGNANALFVDGGNDAIGMGVNVSPVNSASTEGAFFTIGGSFTIASNTEALQINRNGTGGNNRTNIGLYNNGTLRGTIGTLGGQDGIYFQSGGDVDNLQLQDGLSVFNDSSADIDFRVESDSNTHALFVDAGNDAVGIGVSDVADAKLVIRSTGVDGTYNNVLSAQYSGNSNEHNVIGTSVSSTAASSGFIFKASDGGGSTGTTEVLKLTRAGAIFNDASGDQDFRVESDSNTHMLFVDAGNNSVGVGTSTPGSGASLAIKANTGAGAIDLIGRNNGGIGTISFYDDDGSSNVGYIQGRADDNQFRVWTTTSDILSLGQNDAVRLRLTEDGHVHAVNGHLGSAYTTLDNPDRCYWTLSTFNDNNASTSGTINVYTSNTEWQPNLLRITVTSIDSDLTDFGNGVFYVRIAGFHGGGSQISTVDSWTNGSVSVSVSATDIDQHNMQINIAVTGTGNRTAASVEALSYGGVFDSARTG